MAAVCLLVVVVLFTTAAGATAAAVQANEPPDARFDHTPESPSPDQTVTFDASASSDPDGEIVAYRWFVDGDEQFASDATFEYAFDTGGEYEVTLTVIDANGTESTTSRTVTVDNQPPEPRFRYTPERPSPDETVTFDATDSTDPSPRTP